MMDESTSGVDPKQEARRLLAAGQPAAAADLLKTRIELGLADADTYSLMGAALSAQGRMEESLPYLEKAVGLDSARAANYFNLGAVAERLGDRDRARECFTRALQLDPSYSRASDGLQRLAQPAPAPYAAPAAPYTPPAAPAGFGTPAAPGQAMQTDLAGNPIYAPAAPVYAPPLAPPSPYGAPPAPAVDRYGMPIAPGMYAPSYGPGDYAKAPQIVKSARFLSIFVAVLFGFACLAALAAALAGGDGTGMAWVLLIVYVALFVLYIWLARAIKRGVRAAWTVQTVLAFMGLLGFPLGTIIYAYLLFHWFKPEAKAWFGMS